MKKTLLIFTLCTSMLGFKAHAQEPYTLTVFDEAVYYGMYDGLSTTPIPEESLRLKNWCYGKKLTEDQINAIGNRLTINVTAEALCDDYDRIGNVNLAFVPKNATSYLYADVQRIEIGRFITPFMNNITRSSTSSVPYTFEADNIAKILHDQTLYADYDFWIELEIYGHQGAESADQGGAQWDFRASGLCRGRNDVYKGTLELVSENDPTIVQGDNYFKWLSYKFELKDYVQATETNNLGQGTDELGETVRTINFSFDEEVPNAKFYVVMSNHGANANGEEYRNRFHEIYLDDVQLLRYRPGQNCEPFRAYNTMPNGVYGNSVRSEATWLTRSWCPGARIETRIVDLGNLPAGSHNFKMDVPAATFSGNDGYFPMSVYVQGYSEDVAGTEKFKANAFTIAPNPVNDVATINVTNGQTIKTVSVTNTLGQVVMQGNAAAVNMSSLQSGVYIVKVQFENNQVATKKIIKK
ncbi:peptide-N-glycosidase F-related protein [Flavobacterium rivuli]|uniref:peptide-N-glycosidase F-related protein n=1 Tax=Flavobacterium rivuli TaxID=498301 RepID=UPI00036D2AE9|nr:peptide-N-glycosidase F-related protein [Flavobacterium rivuli]